MIPLELMAKFSKLTYCPFKYIGYKEKESHIKNFPWMLKKTISNFFQNLNLSFKWNGPALRAKMALLSLHWKVMIADNN